MTDPTDRTVAGPAPYQVLARKYRPGHFRDLLGQEAMVRSLTRSFEQGRIAQAFVLTGVRGVGKTTTARIIAKGLNCTAQDGPTMDPCGTCPACVSIAEGRNVDVLEIDAASNNGVDFVRDLNEMVRYRPVETRYKLIILDEAHQLTPASFNALLKTLEEPPPHVKFMFATTEIQKMPVTILSRCQRFDLRRITPEVLGTHLAEVAAAEGAAIDAEALALIVRAAGGSVRDALSLLDQALTPGRTEATSAAEVASMLGLADRQRVIDLFEAVMRGDAATALDELRAQYADGADPEAVLRALAEVTHAVSVRQVSAAAWNDATVSPSECARLQDLSDRLPMRALTRAWQMLLKALEEVRLAPDALSAAEMAIIRLTHVADLPSPEEVLRRLLPETPAPEGAAGGQTAANALDGQTRDGQTKDGSASQCGAASGVPLSRTPSAVATGAARGGGAPAGGPAGAVHQAPRLVSVGGGRGHRGGAQAQARQTDADPDADAVAEGQAHPMPEPALVPVPEPEPEPVDELSPLATFAGLEDVTALLRERRELRLLEAVEQRLRLVAFRPGVIEVSPTPGAESDLCNKLSETLRRLTGHRWSVAVSDAPGQPTLAAQRAEADAARRAQAANHPLVRAVLGVFPGAEIRDVRPLRGPSATPAPLDYLPAIPERDEVDGDLVDGDDPFEEM